MTMSDLVKTLGTSLAAWVPSMTLATGLLLAAAVVVDRLLAHRVAASARLWLYVAVAARLALPADWRAPLGLLGVGGGAAPAVSAGTPVVLAGAASPAAATVGSPLFWAGLAYFAVAGALLLYWGRARLKLQRELARAVPARAEVAAVLPGITVLEHPTLGPLATGVRAPRVVLPAALAASADAETLRCVLRHEGAHLRRRDPLLMALLQVVCALAWPILPLWVAAARIRALVELASDERALAGAGAGARRRYGEVLLAMADGEASAATARFAFTPSFGWALRGRVRALAFARRWPRPLQLALVAGCGAVAFACAGGTEAPPPAAESAKATERTTDPPVLTMVSPTELYLGKLRVTPERLAEELKGLVDQGAERLVVRGNPGVLEQAEKAGVDVLSIAKKAGVHRLMILKDLHPSAAETRPTKPDTIPGRASVRGKMDPDVVRRIVRRHINEMKFCYEEGLRAQPAMAGRGVVEFTIDATGAVIGSVLQSSTLDNATVENCLVTAVRRWKFPEPEGGGSVVVSYPFVFTPGP
jgi:TonB family protein